MKLKFDATLDYQLEAIQSVADLFEGLSAQATLSLTYFSKCSAAAGGDWV